MANKGVYIPKFQGGGGVSLSSLLAGSAKGWAAKNLAKKDTAQRKKEGIWASIMGLAKPLAAFGSKAALAGLNITSGGALTPLLMGLGTAGFSKLFDVVGRKFGAGADPSKIKATGKYGYGKEAAKTLSEGLAESIKERDPFSKENIGADVIGSYVSALTPKLGIDPKTGEMGVEGGGLGEDVIGAIKDKDLSKLSLLDLDEKGFTQEAFNKLGNLKDEKGRKSLMDLITTTEGVVPDTTDMDAEMYKQLLDPSPVGTNYTEIGGFDPPDLPYEGEDFALSESFAQNIPSTMPTAAPSRIPSQFTSMGDVLPYSPYDFPMPEVTGSSLDTLGTIQGSYDQPYVGHAQRLQESMQLRDRLGFQQGGQVPSQSPTIADYFNQQGKTIGGSNTQSIGQMLGRR